MKISIQGNQGSYSHIAAKHLYGGDIELLERDSFKEVFDDLQAGLVDFALIPIENSTYGSIYQNFDFLTQHHFHIIKELYLIINFHLIAHPGTHIKDITDLYCHPVGLGQIRSFLEEHPSIKSHEFPDTAGSVKMVKEKGLKNAAGAASKLAADLYGMEVIKEKIQQNKKNYTRFFVLSHNEDYSKKANKTTIQFELGEEVGSLHKALEFFHRRNISLTKIESRPILHTEWEYTFYVDFLSGLDKNMNEALKELKYLVHHLRILGSYEKGDYIET